MDIENMSLWQILNFFSGCKGSNQWRYSVFIFLNHGHACKYFEIDEFKDKVKNSITGKFNEFKNFINELNYNKFKISLICIQETWNIPVHFNTNIPGYNPLVYKLRDISDRNKNNIGGGVAIWVDNQLEFEIKGRVSKQISKLKNKA